MTWISFPDPHHPFDCPEPWSRLHHPDEIDIPEHLERDFDTRPWWHRAVLENEPTGSKENAETRKAYSRISGQSEQQLREIIANTYGQISLIDHQVGRLMIALDELGMRDNTYVIYSSDHGDWLGDHGLILKGPMHYEGLHRVGMIVRGPNVPAGKTITAPTTHHRRRTHHVRLRRRGATANAARANHCARCWKPTVRRARSPSANGNCIPTAPASPSSLRTVRTETAKLTVDLKSGAGELYDLSNDPNEMTNRFDDPAYKSLSRTSYSVTLRGGRTRSVRSTSRLAWRKA